MKLQNNTGTVLYGVDATTHKIISGNANHETVLLRGIPIDKQIAPIINSLWEHRIETMLSCQDVDGCIYIAFKNLRDALKGGFLISDAFVMRTMDTHNYLAMAVFVHPALAHVACGKPDVEGAYRHLAPKIKKNLKAYKKSGLFDICCGPRRATATQKEVDLACDDFIKLGGWDDVFYLEMCDYGIEIAVNPSWLDGFHSMVYKGGETA